MQECANTGREDDGEEKKGSRLDLIMSWNSGTPIRMNEI